MLVHEAECFKSMVARWVRLEIPFHEWERFMRLVYILEALHLERGNQVHAARRIHLHRNTLRYAQDWALQGIYSPPQKGKRRAN